MEFLEDNDPLMMQASFEPTQEDENQKTRGPSRHSNASKTMGVTARSSKKSATASVRPNQNEIGKYSGEEDEIVCGRFPHMDVCACDIQCSIALREINLFEVYDGILMGPY